MKRILSVVLGLTIGIVTGWGVAAYASRSSTGTYTLPAGNPVTTGTTITSTWANNTLSDISTEITGSLSRSGYGGMLAALRGTNGSVSAPAFSFTSDTNTGMYRAAADDLRLSIGGADSLTIGASSTAVAGVTNYVTVGGLRVRNNLGGDTGQPLSVYGGFAGTTMDGSYFSPSSTYTGTPTAYTLSLTGRAGTTGGSTGGALAATGGAATTSGVGGAAIIATGGDAQTAGQGGPALTATAGASITSGANAIGATGTGTGSGISATGGATGPGGTFTAGGSGSPTAGQIHLTPTTNVPSAATDGDIYFKTSGPMGWKANSVKFAAYKGTCVLGTSCSAIAVSEASYCVCTDATSAAACKAVMASSAPTATVTFTGTGTDTLYYICL